MRRVFFQPLVLLGLGLGSAFLAGAAARWEAAPFLNQGLTEREREADLASGALRPGLSRESWQLVVGDCVNNLHSLYMRIRPTEEREAAAEICRNLAAESVRVMPTFSFGWLVLAAVESDLDRDVAAFNRALENSQITGPGEQWIAESRVPIAEDRLADLSEAAFTGHEADLRLLVQSKRGIASIAARYVDDPDFRERITSIVETLPREAQQAFVQEVQYAAGKQ